MVTLEINGIERHFDLETHRETETLWLIAVDENGEPIDGGNILWIDDVGILRRCQFINPDTGVSLVGENRQIAQAV